MHLVSGADGIISRNISDYKARLRTLLFLPPSMYGRFCSRRNECMHTQESTPRSAILSSSLSYPQAAYIFRLSSYKGSNGGLRVWSPTTGRHSSDLTLLQLSSRYAGQQEQGRGDESGGWRAGRTHVLPAGELFFLLWERDWNMLYRGSELVW